MIIKLLVDGAEMKPGPAVAQKLGPIGINMGKVISDVNSATKDFKGMKVPVELDIDEKTKDFSIKTFSPPTSELLKKELGLEKGSNDHKKLKVGNASIEDVIKVTKVKHPDMLQKDFKSSVKSVLGTCKTLGLLVENEDANELISKVDEGVFDSEINNQATEATAEKKQKLKEFFDKVVQEQEVLLKQEEAEAKEAEKAKEESTLEKSKTAQAAESEEKKEGSADKK